MNEIATALRTWLDDAGITVAVLHSRLSPDHFHDCVVPPRRKLYDFCAGKGLSWAFVEAVADACTPGDSPAQQRKLRAVRQLWEVACTNPTPLGGGRDLMEAKDQVIASYERIERLQQAQAESEQARLRAEHLVTMLLTMLGQLFAKIGDLTQHRDQLLAERSPNPAALTALEGRLQEAAGHREETEEALGRAQRERDEALQMAAEARRVARRLQEELDWVRAGESGPAAPPTSADLGPDHLDTADMPVTPDPDDLFLHDYAEALRKARTVLDSGSAALQAAGEQIAEADAVLRPDSGDVVPGMVLSRTTPDNPVTGADAEFEDRYATYLARRNGTLTIFGADLEQSWSLDHAYVSLEVSSAPGSVERVEQALAGRQRTVVMGTPGSGKTTLLQWLALNASRRTLPDRLEHLNGSVPFMLPLRSLAHHDSFPRPEEMLAAVGCPLAGQQPEGWASRVFEHGRALVLVDGVDEIAQGERARARKWLEAMLAAHPRGCYVVTTRVAAVPADWLDGVGFRHLLLRHLSADDVVASISRWHAAVRFEADEEDHLVDILEESVQNAVRNDRNLAALAVSPLLVSLLCALHRTRRGVLPRSVMNLYGAALSMLLVRRDAERGISSVEGTQITEAEAVQLLQTLAYWMIRNSRSHIDAATAIPLLSTVLEAMPAIQSEAEEILDHLLIRSGLLRVPAIDRLEFIHRTFQDYLGAQAAVESTDFSLLVANAHEEQWENVLKMATGHGRPHERAELLRALVDRGDQDELLREQLHRLAASCLEYATELSPEVREMVRQRTPERER
ncbi:NACHT domain-containing protein [Streptomyces anulatus]